MNDLHIIKFAAKECKLQNSGEMSVYWMLNAWDFAQTSVLKGTPLTQNSIFVLGSLVEPKKNRKGYRTIPVMLGTKLLDNQQLIFRQIENLVAAQDELSPAEFYREFETIHPFIDGNGRTGAIIYNWLKETLDDPVFPPNFWDS